MQEEYMSEEVKEVAEETAEAPKKKESRTYEISFEDLGLTKPLDKMTAKELRALCVAKIPAIVGASGMAKDELVSNIKEIFGINDDEGNVSPYKDQIQALKKEIKELRVKKEAVEARKDREVLRRKINKLKKRTRRLANAV
jgi:FtsZ-binding cell division protein ZapB